MPFSGSDLFNFIIQLNQKKADFDHSEAFCRTIVSRAYYSAFLEARTLVGLPENEKKGVHKKVGDKISLLDTTTGNRLFDLIKLRISADYKSNAPINQRDASKAIRLSDLVIKYCQNPT